LTSAANNKTHPSATNISEQYMTDKSDDATHLKAKASIKALMVIPGVGKSIANDLLQIGITEVEQLKGKDPVELFQTSNAHVGVVQDICLLYVFRCAVYFAQTAPGERDPEKLKWWNWK
jgi:hypothetical protein